MIIHEGEFTIFYHNRKVFKVISLKMRENSTHLQGVLYDPTYLFYVVSFLPCVIILFCLCVFSVFDHKISAGDDENIPSLSEVMMLMPESRIFAVGMIITDFFMLPIFIITHSIVTTICKNEKHEGSVFYRLIMDISAIIVFCSLIIISSVTISESKRIHMIFLHLFLFTMHSYFSSFDLIMLNSKSHKSKLSISFDILLFLCYIISTLMQILGNNIVEFIGNILQQIVFIMLFVKFLDMKRSIPKFQLQLVKKNNS
ncbi:hypothetical protein TRFO_17273 [Tritrichomonas foetus]|uniref:CWH43-like N-terminal domain-containing protein n=1 Tax=Tritrichomonas foetus TaxID=1144522 RepID=A0A1J4KNI5_9EUKA|nr:hypothetical protein TRFO_17273 [Tritrichomonas foetus]|eukprot:OHT12803.1 hypothetical protein TRFO_17273 [Tritrichomonas foetus]